MSKTADHNYVTACFTLHNPLTYRALILLIPSYEPGFGSLQSHIYEHGFLPPTVQQKHFILLVPDHRKPNTHASNTHTHTPQISTDALSLPLWPGDTSKQLCNCSYRVVQVWFGRTFQRSLRSAPTFPVLTYLSTDWCVTAGAVVLVGNWLTTALRSRINKF